MIENFLKEYKKITKEMIKSVEMEDLDKLDSLIDKRKLIIDKINEEEYTEDNFKEISKELKLQKIEKELENILDKKKQYYKEVMSKVNKNQKAHKVYNDNFIKKTHVFRDEI